MSINHMQWAWLAPRLTPSERLVMLAVAEMTDHDGVADISTRQLVEKTKLAPRTVQRGLKSLERAALIINRGQANAHSGNQLALGPFFR